ncbi:transketolase [Lusitaniella coriacea LEGE 07157]|uniref:Transketolase n=1 Tax=Lusitaniella coriacea LEGE 07157 TaxID=945747 RepID=A0A8J7DZZ3_9CYAN|nr:transketolase C-terminal domain-containing protein [Lusitaniella coriacea]MBE9116876.1 transketolase [Lusitaniella coriacea LEGE 07157]
MRKLCLEKVYEFAKNDERIFFMGSDLGFGTLNQFKEEIPGRFLMEGVNEANIIGIAAGLALEGRIVYVNTIATFITRRCFEQVVLDLGLHNVNVRLIGNGGGVVYAPLGPTHLAIDDIAILRAIPNMTIVAPADEAEMGRLMPLTVEHPGPMYIRLGKGNEPILTTDDIPFAIGKVFPMREGSDALIITTGVTLKASLDAADTLKQQGISTAVLHVPTVKPLDTTALLEHMASVPVVVTIEEHTLMGGLGSAVAEIVAEANFNPSKRFKRIGIPDVFPDKYGAQLDVMARYGISAEKLVAVVEVLSQ